MNGLVSFIMQPAGPPAGSGNRAAQAGWDRPPALRGCIAPMESLAAGSMSAGRASVSVSGRNQHVVKPRLMLGVAVPVRQLSRFDVVGHHGQQCERVADCRRLCRRGLCSSGSAQASDLIICSAAARLHQGMIAMSQEISRPTPLQRDLSSPEGQTMAIIAKQHLGAHPSHLDARRATRQQPARSGGSSDHPRGREATSPYAQAGLPSSCWPLDAPNTP